MKLKLNKEDWIVVLCLAILTVIAATSLLVRSCDTTPTKVEETPTITAEIVEVEEVVETEEVEVITETTETAETTEIAVDEPKEVTKPTTKPSKPSKPTTTTKPTEPPVEKEEIEEVEKPETPEAPKEEVKDDTVVETEPPNEDEEDKEDKIENVNLGRFKLTAYCPCSKCNGKWSNQTSTGVTPTAGRTIAVDPRVIPYFSKVLINGHTYTAEDCGGGIKGNRIDVYFNTHSEAMKFGVQYADVYLIRS